MFPALPILDRLQDCWDRISKDQLAQLEADLGVVFPQDYRNFLLKFNAGTWAHRVAVRVRQPTQFADEVLPRHNLGIVPDRRFAYADIAETVEAFDGRIPETFLPIMSHGLSLICMRFGDDDHGRIYFWDGAHEGSDELLVHLVGDNFMDFLTHMTPHEYVERLREQLPIFQAVERGDREAVTQYLFSGGKIDVRNERGWTLLMCAARNSWPRFVEMLLKVGADPNAVDAEACTPMAHAVCGQSLDSIKLLMEFEARTDYRDARGRNLAQIAKDEHYHRIYYYLAPYMAYP